MIRNYTNTWNQSRRPRLLRAASGMGEVLVRCGINLALSPDALVAAAQRRTRLSDWDGCGAGEGLKQLTHSLEHDDRLDYVGRLVAREYLISLLANRMRIQRDLARDARITTTTIPRPLFVVGLPRTGTTLLYNLLAQDPARRPLLTWEALWPAPLRDGEQPQRRIRRAKRLVAALNYGTPQLRTIHPLAHDMPEECTWLMAHTFSSPAFLMAADLTSYEQWLWDRSLRNRCSDYEYYKQLLQRLQWQDSERPWLLKSPAHMYGLDALLRTFPHAAIVFTQRDPTDVIASGCSMFALTRSFFAKNVDPIKLGSKYARTSAMLAARADDCRRQSPENFIDVSYGRLVSEPLTVLREIYDELDEVCGDELMKRWHSWLARNPRNRHGVHRYDLGQFGLERSQIAEMFEPVTL